MSSTWRPAPGWGGFDEASFSGEAKRRPENVLDDKGLVYEMPGSSPGMTHGASPQLTGAYFTAQP